MMEWISIKDKLPEETKSVLLYFRYFAADFHFCGYIKNGIFYNNAENKPLHTITHWMPLPEPPKE